MRVNLDRLFKYHRPRGTQPSRYAELRKAARAHADAIVAHTPESAEQTLAIRAVHQASMLANSAIAVNEPDADEADPAWRAVTAADESPTLGDLQSPPAASLRAEQAVSRDADLDTRYSRPSVPTRDTAGEWDHGRRLRPGAPVMVACARCTARLPFGAALALHPVGAVCPSDQRDRSPLDKRDIVLIMRDEFDRVVREADARATVPVIEGLRSALDELTGEQSAARP